MVRLRLCLLLIWLAGTTGVAADVWKFPNAVRLTGGVGVSSVGAALDGRILAGRQESSLRYGLQMTALQQIRVRLSTTSDNAQLEPVRNTSSLHALVGWEGCPQGPFSAMLFGGLGIAHSRDRSQDSYGGYSRESDPDESITSPSFLVGGDVGVSLWRHVGLSLQAGVLVAHGGGGFVTLQTDVGAW